jgi:50S ribosomal subunit-associated GTPase HflX
MYQNRNNNYASTSVLSTSPLESILIKVDINEHPEENISEIKTIEAPQVSISNKLDTITAHNKNNFELFKAMYSAVNEISKTQNNFSDLLTEILKQQTFQTEMLNTLLTKKEKEEELKTVASSSDLKKSLSSQLLKPKKKI